MSITPLNVTRGVRTGLNDASATPVSELSTRQLKESHRAAEAIVSDMQQRRGGPPSDFLLHMAQQNRQDIRQELWNRGEPIKADT